MAELKSNADVDLTTMSRDAANSTYHETTPDDLDADAGRHVAQVLGEPKATSSKARAPKG